MRYWCACSSVLLTLGLIIHYSAWKANKQIWSPSYLFIMAGACGFVLTAFYVLLDWRSWQPKFLSGEGFIWKGKHLRPTDILRPFVWVGLNTIFIYLMAPSGDVWGDIQVGKDPTA